MGKCTHTYKHTNHNAQREWALNNMFPYAYYIHVEESLMLVSTGKVLQENTHLSSCL